MSKLISKPGYIIGAIIAALVLIYVILGFVFSGRFIVGTKVNGINAGFATPKSLEHRVEAASKDYEIAIETKGSVVDTIKGTDIGLKSDPQGGEAESFLESQNGFAWPVKLFKPDSFIGEKLVSFDAQALKNKVSALKCVNNPGAVKTEDATYEYKDGGFKIVDEVYGTEIDQDDFVKGIGKNIMLLSEKVDLEADGLYKQPQIKKDDKELNNFVDKLNKTIDVSIDYDEGESVSKDDIASWIAVGEGYDFEVDREKVEEYVKGLEKKYNTFGQPKQLKTSLGSTVTVPGGNYGWKIDKEAEVNQLMEEIKAGEPVKREINYQYTAASHGDVDYGNSYVEVNLSAQQLYLYKDGKQVLTTPFVSGNLAKGHGTHTGAFRIAYCQRNAVLRGQDYATPVNFWMPFNMGEGLHDATWRSSFGGNIFRTSGSHGCVNLPYKAAQTIFGEVKAGFPVLVYSTGGTENTYTAVNTETSKTVTNKINAIGVVTLESEAAIGAARAAYNKLADAEKAKVANIAVLDAAENQLAVLKAQSQMAPIVPPVPVVPEVPVAPIVPQPEYPIIDQVPQIVPEPEVQEIY